MGEFKKELERFFEDSKILATLSEANDSNIGALFNVLYYMIV